MDSAQYTQNAIKVYFDFLEDVNSGKLKNDGSCRLLNLIDKYILRLKETKVILPRGKKLYRARLINISDLNRESGIYIDDDWQTIGFNESNSREVPPGKGKEGRNNVAGASYLYAANRVETACVEAKPSMSQLVSVAIFRVKEPLELLDFASDYTFNEKYSEEEELALGVVFTFVMTQMFSSAIDSSEYHASQVLSEHIRKYGMDGIAYRSLYDRRGTNYTIYKCHRDCIEYVGSKVVMLQKEKMTFTDFNKSKTFRVESEGSDKFDADEAKVILGLNLARIVENDSGK